MALMKRARPASKPQPAPTPPSPPPAPAIATTARKFSGGASVEAIKEKLKREADRRREAGEWSQAQIIIKRYKERVRNPLTAIRANCIECSGGSFKEVAECKIVKCALHPFRMGTNPFNKKTQARMAREAGETPEDDDDSDLSADEVGDEPEPNHVPIEE